MIFNYEFRGEQHSRTKYVIYLITFSSPDQPEKKKYYVGQTRRMLFQRWADYKRDLIKPIEVEKRNGCNIKLRNSVLKQLKKQENQNTDFLHLSIIEVVDISHCQTDEEKQELLNQRETHHIKEYRKLYGKTKVCNIRDGGTNHTWTDEDILSQSEKLKLYFQTPEGIKQREKDSENKKDYYSNKENHPMFGKIHTDETKEILSNFFKEKFSNKENHPSFGRIASLEVREKMSKSRQGRKVWNTGKSNCYSPEVLQKMSNSKIGKYTGMKSPNSKIYDLSQNPLISPNGEEFIRIECLLEFCRKYDLQEPNIRKLLNRQRKSHKGWHLRKFS